MNKDKASNHIKQNLPSNEDLIGFFQAQSPPKFWLYFIMGPLATLAIKFYFIAVTNKGVYFFKLNLLGKFTQQDFFSYDEIEKTEIGKGTLTVPMMFFFTNGTKLKIKAQKKGLERVAKLEEKTLDYMKKNIKFS